MSVLLYLAELGGGQNKEKKTSSSAGEGKKDGGKDTAGKMEKSKKDAPKWIVPSTEPTHKKVKTVQTETTLKDIMNSGNMVTCGTIVIIINRNEYLAIHAIK